MPAQTSSLSLVSKASLVYAPVGLPSGSESVYGSGHRLRGSAGAPPSSSEMRWSSSFEDLCVGVAVLGDLLDLEWFGEGLGRPDRRGPARDADGRVDGGLGGGRIERPRSQAWIGFSRQPVRRRSTARRRHHAGRGGTNEAPALAADWSPTSTLDATADGKR